MDRERGELGERRGKDSGVVKGWGDERQGDVGSVGAMPDVEIGLFRKRRCRVSEAVVCLRLTSWLCQRLLGTPRRTHIKK